MRAALGGAPVAAASAPAAAARAASALPSADPSLAAGVLAALGGAGNVSGVECAANRLLLALADPGKIDADKLRQLGVRAVAKSGETSAQLILAADAAPLAGALADAKGR